MPRNLSVAVIGASGAVGSEFLGLFERRMFPIGKLDLVASERSAGKKIAFLGSEHTFLDLAAYGFEGVDVAFFSAGATRSREFAAKATAAGAVVIDNSSAFRMDPRVPLVVPEVNFGAICADDKLIANPNCTAAILVMALAPLAKLGALDRVIVSTYQSASGAGASAMQELLDQSREVIEGREPKPRVFPYPCAFNLFSHNTPVGEDGWNEEESKVAEETRKIMGMPDLKLNVTCIRVPVLRAHSESVTVEYAGAAPTEEQVREALAAFPGVKVIDDRQSNRFPMPMDASGSEEVYVGRVRRDPSHPSAISLFVCGDQLLKGAALNAIQIAEKMFGVR